MKKISYDLLLISFVCGLNSAVLYFDYSALGLGWLFLAFQAFLAISLSAVAGSIAVFLDKEEEEIWDNE